MKPIRGAMWLLPLAVGCMALPPQSQTHSKTNDKTKQTKVPLYFIKNEAELSAITLKGNSNGNGTTTGIRLGADTEISGNNNSKGGVDGVASKPPSHPLGVSATTNSDKGTTLPPSSLPIISTSTSPLTNYNSPVQMIQPPSTSSSSSVSSIADFRTESGTSTISNRGTTTTARTTTKTPTTITTNTGSVNTSSSALPTETSSRTIASNQDASTFVSSSKKSTTSSHEFTTTPAAVSSKGAADFPGKIRPQIKLNINYANLSETGVRLPEGASAALAKPTRYHYYPHNQEIYLLPECAVQQVCNAVYVRLNFTQPLCACSARYGDPCSASLESDDLHTTELVTDPRTKALTLVKTCEPVAEMRECRTPRDWSLLALQNVRTGKSHYLVICRCPDANILEGPMSHDQPTYASVPGIRVYGMMCVQGNRRGRPLRYTRSLSDYSKREISGDSVLHNEKEDTNDRLSFPWYKVQQLMDAAVWD
ncbi:doublesex cognate 73A [Xylocopa sonorina]|uniref:doublesex cognate 73A n=1 Tax=Xylocopa sonorina TaxID=1818115 RepID=UPI00403A7D85